VQVRDVACRLPHAGRHIKSTTSFTYFNFPFLDHNTRRLPMILKNLRCSLLNFGTWHSAFVRSPKGRHGITRPPLDRSSPSGDGKSAVTMQPEEVSSSSQRRIRTTRTQIATKYDPSSYFGLASGSVATLTGQHCVWVVAHLFQTANIRELHIQGAT
jgi:hypothetical protein